ncbi:MAG TPA: hypothetical protein PLN21_22620, partial [Gemmatales bacterium]|nr:hypothetical protein [Gemmatales bacterium]
MLSSKKIFLIVATSLVLATGVVGVIILNGRSTNLDSSRLADRLIARERWLALFVKEGESVYKDSVNAKLLVCCFVEGETLIDCDSL